PCPGEAAAAARGTDGPRRPAGPTDRAAAKARSRPGAAQGRRAARGGGETSGPRAAPVRPAGHAASAAVSPESGPDAPLPRDGSAAEARAEGASLAARILALLGPSPVAEDQVLRDLGLPPQSVAEELLALELDGRVERRPGGLLALAG
ncbi:MAG: hypothetical protein N2Z62_04320, partial [Rhodobacteraceae bacterium]|nr:hypothetical protein [Paracoccaceae bacterium]